MFAALLDTSVIWPSLQRDFLLSLAAEHLYPPIWSSATLAELQLHETRKLVNRGVPEPTATERVQFLLPEMRRALDDSEIEGWEALQGSYGLPDPNDEHVLAAAVVGGEGAIVTANLKDFPAACVPKGLQILSPAEFALNTVSHEPHLSLHALEAISASSRSKGPARSVEELLIVLVERYGLNDAVEVLHSVIPADDE